MSDAKSKISQEVLDLSKVLAKGISIKVEKGTPVAKAEVVDALYAANLPANVTEDNLKAVQQYNSTFMAAATHAFGQQAIATMAKNKSVEEVVAEIPMFGKDEFSVGMERSKKFHNPGTGAETDPTYGFVTAKLVTAAARSNRGMINHVRKELQEEALKALA